MPTHFLPIFRLFHLAVFSFIPSIGAADALQPRQQQLTQEVTYLSVHAFLHAYDELPKVLLLLPPEPDGAPAGEAPSWYSSSAMHFKNGRKKTASFAFVAADSVKVASRFGISDVPLGGTLVACTVDGAGGGTFHIFGKTLRSGGGDAVRATKAFVDLIIDGADGGSPLPAFPPPDVPRKQAATSLVELTHANIDSKCYASSVPLCVVALLPSSGSGCPSAFSELARRHRNDAVRFGWVRAGKQVDFLDALSLETGALPVLIALKAGKRSRFARLAAPLDLERMGAFVDRILGGDMSFSKLQQLPELLPPALLVDDDSDGDDAAPEETKSEL